MNKIMHKGLCSHIFSFLAVSDIVSSSTVCKEWYVLATDDLLWKRFFFEELLEMSNATAAIMCIASSHVEEENRNEIEMLKTVDFIRKAQEKKNMDFREAYIQLVAPWFTSEQNENKASKDLNQKWREILNDWDTHFNNSKVSSLLQRGIPSKFRGRVWKQLTGSPALKERNKGLYKTLINQKRSSYEVKISRDVTRTYPNNPFFEFGKGTQLLFSVLKAYSIYDQNIGYCQGMGFVAGHLLMYMPEEDAFWVMVQLFRKPKLQLGSQYLSGLPGLENKLFILEKMIEKLFPKVYRNFENEGVHTAMFASAWFMTIYAGSLPLELVGRIWDLYLLEGTQIIFKIALALIKSAHDIMLTLSFEKKLHYFQNYSNNKNLPNVETIIKTANGITIPSEFSNIM